MEDQEAQAAPSLKTSVLIVSFNSEPALKRCVAALEGSEPRDTFEILVVDCGSADGSPHVDEEFPDVTVLRLPHHFGRTKGRNIGSRTAKGEFLFLLDPEVLVRPGTIAALTEKLEADAGTVGVAPLLVTAAGEPVSRGGGLPGPAALYRSWCTGAPWFETNPVVETLGDAALELECPDPRALLVRTKAVKGMNYFDERYGEFGSDLELYTQAFKASRKLCLATTVQADWAGEEGLWRPPDDTTEEALSADFAVGAIAYTQKHLGWRQGLRLRVRMFLRAIGHFQFGLLMQILNGQKIDGSQRAI